MPTIRIPVSQPSNQRGTGFVSNRDAYRSNVMDEVYQDKIYTVKRPGYALTQALGAGTGQGIVNYGGIFYAVIGDSLKASAAAPASGATGATWANIGNAPWAVRTVSGVVVMGGSMYVMAGYSVVSAADVVYNDVWSSVDGVNWTICTSSPPWNGRDGFASAVLNDKIYVIGGEDVAGNRLNDVWSSPDGTTWTQETAAAAFSKRCAMGCLSNNNGIYIFGGRDTTKLGANAPLADIWYSSNGSTWNNLQINGTSWSARSHVAVFFYNNVFYLAGGLEGASPGTAVNDCWSSPNGQTWTKIANAPFPSARYIPGYAVYNKKMYLVGGFGAAGALADVLSSTDGITWTTVTGAGAFGPKGFTPMVVFRTPSSVSAKRYDTMWFCGGVSTGPTAFYNTVYYAVLDIVTPTTNALAPAVAGQPFQFNSFVEGTKLLVKNQCGLWVWDEGGVTKVTDAGYPATTVPGLVVLGASAYVMDPTGLIRNCVLDDPYQWPSLNALGADYADDPGVAIAKYQNYLVAFGTYTIQFFYDAGVNPGSPLLPYLNSNMKIGCAAAATVAEVGNTIVWVSQTQQLERQVMVFNGLQPTPISTPFIDKILSEANQTNINGMAMGVDGHLFYLLNITDSNGTLQTHVYDFSTKNWYLWDTPYFLSGFKFAGYCISYAPKGYYMLGATDGNIYNVSTNYLTDAGVSFAVTIQTDKFDAGNNRTKFWGQFEVISDKNAGTPDIYFADNDYNTYSVARTVDLSTPRPILYRNGSSRNRAIRYVQTDANPLRLEAFEMTYEQGL